MADERPRADETPGYRLSSYRMSMLAHGFTEEPGRRWMPTLNPWLRPEGLHRSAVGVVALIVIAAAVVAAVLLL